MNVISFTNLGRKMMMDTQLLMNKVAIITGAGSGMGAAMAKLFAKEGAKVVAADLNIDNANKVIKDIQADGYEAAAIKVNVADRQDISSMFAFAKDHYDHVDILVNNAGIMDNMAAIGDLEDDEWHKVMAVNTDSVMYGMREAIREFLPKHTGVILNIASIGGTNGARAGAAYTASKHAVVGLTKNTAYMYANEGIRVNAIAPGGIQTNIAQTMGNINEFGMKRQMTGMQTSPKPGSPEEIADTALFLVSDKAAYITGAVLPVDGGWTAY
ncbi:glucose 1-dehydrogenase [Lentilactobacillus hilgardii]|uniref:Oxidoreductase, short chain dehydrogenase/reductase family protein n=1 Tax=Lentilactobacillus hilgardii (strain ATCC 8290 / DSM 20176 / CCUG 30140 / JCM 1155 / KCTC 3500 / NBRC 15886 / NCIMB 8040 / NRRL B-1843 / 9) TaxID=1423757 RepID=C0XH15_LENH9|nr:glucose 1-dehydrogenase [Lentilactobacillus hilgardii]EEI25330.1 oxidoreductase, short chain dehydrogenase/reductase family protein [Lentilactobacillus hilgardii DSM 20176 = ATCC 8290]QEU39806.1 glucose 1-dehydrogenase [Lentilactobacillus hilgardii]